MTSSLARDLGRVFLALTLVLLVVAMTFVAHAQSTGRPQLVVERERAEADLPAAILLIGGQKLLWNNDSEVVVTLA